MCASPNHVRFFRWNTSSCVFLVKPWTTLDSGKVPVDFLVRDPRVSSVFHPVEHQTRANSSLFGLISLRSSAVQLCATGLSRSALRSRASPRQGWQRVREKAVEMSDVQTEPPGLGGEPPPMSQTHNPWPTPQSGRALFQKVGESSFGRTSP